MQKSEVSLQFDLEDVIKSAPLEVKAAFCVEIKILDENTP